MTVRTFAWMRSFGAQRSPADGGVGTPRAGQLPAPRGRRSYVRFLTHRRIASPRNMVRQACYLLQSLKNETCNIAC